MFAFVFCSHTHTFLFLSTWFRSGVDSRHFDRGRFSCFFVCWCLEFSEAPVRVTLDLVFLSLGLGVTATSDVGGRVGLAISGLHV